MKQIATMLVCLTFLAGCAATNKPSPESLNTMSVQELNELSVKLWKNGKYSDPELALKYAELASQKDPEYGRAYYTKGFAYYNLKQYDLSIQNFTKSIELDPNIAEAYNGRGWVYGTIDEYSKALDDFSKAIEIDDSYALAYNNRGLTYVHLKNNDNACKDYKRACQLGDCRPYNDAKSKGICR